MIQTIDLSPDAVKARAIAIGFHFGQMYGDEPYVNHLEEVAGSVAKGCTDGRGIIVGYLHDILEDTACTKEILYSMFEDNVVDAVVALTRTPNEDKWVYLRRVKANPLARVVKMHDSLCNLRASIMRFDARRITKYTTQIGYLANGEGPA